MTLISVRKPWLYAPRHVAEYSQKQGCVFCAISRGDSPAKVLDGGAQALIIEPLNPVTPGHVLVIPHVHIDDFTDGDGHVAAATMRVASAYAADLGGPCNLITSKGPEATQTVPHLHLHIVPRREGDGLALPWTGQERTQ